MDYLIVQILNSSFGEAQTIQHKKAPFDLLK